MGDNILLCAEDVYDLRHDLMTARLGLINIHFTERLHHIMNDLAQSIMGALPEHKGDLLCRVIRHDKVGGPSDKGEDNGDEALRGDQALGGLYQAAFPSASLNAHAIRELREGARLLLNFDKGIYKAGDQMTSPVSTHWGLFGEDSYRNRAVGEYLKGLLTARGLERLRALYADASDPVSRALAPLLRGEELSARRYELPPRALTPFEAHLGRRLSSLLEHRLSKPMLLRTFALGAAFGLILRFYGAGDPEGRPALLALPTEGLTGPSPLRSAAAQSLARGLDRFERSIADELSRHEPWAALLDDPRLPAARAVTLLELPARLEGSALAYAALREVRALKDLVGRGDKSRNTYKPEGLFLTLGQSIGAISPKNNQAGWSKHLSVSPDLLEALMLMYLDPDPSAPPRPWRALWREVREELGVMIGVNADEEGDALERLGVLHVNLEHLAESGEHLLTQAAARGLARRLPDSGAETGVDLR